MVSTGVEGGAEEEDKRPRDWKVERGICNPAMPCESSAGGKVKTAYSGRDSASNSNGWEMATTNRWMNDHIHLGTIFRTTVYL